MRARWQRGSTIIAVVAFGLAVGAPAVSPPAGAVGQRAAAVRRTPPLPTAQLSSTDLHVGDEVTLTGSGCVDPDTGSGAGLYVYAYQIDPDHRIGTFLGSFQPTVAVADDGWFSLTATIGQPLATGHQQVVAACITAEQAQRVNEEHLGGGPSLVPFAPIDVTTTAPPMQGLQVADGVATFNDPCTDTVVTNDREGVIFAADGTPRVLPYLDGAGSRIRYEIPSDLAPGSYLLDYNCGVNRAYPNAFQRSAVTLIDRRSSVPSTTSGATSRASTTQPKLPPKAAPATGARPVDGSASYTG